MATRRWKRLAALFKLETVYGTDAAPTGAANFIQLSDAQFTPLAGEEEARNLLQPRLGHQGTILTGDYGQFDFSVEIAGSGAAGTAPAWGTILRGCGFMEVVSAGTGVAYMPIDDDFEAATLYYNADGVNHIFVGARGTVSLNFTPKRIPKFRFSIKGLLGEISDMDLPAVTQSMWQRPVVVSKANTTMDLHGWGAVAESLNIDVGNQVVPRHLIGAESIEISDRSATGTAVVEARSLATVNWFDIARDHALDDLELVHGTTAGNIVEVTADGVQIGRPTEGQTDNIRNYSLPLMLTSLNDNELTIIAR